MTPPTESPRVSPGGLVTVAYLKARLDEGVDHLDIFTPLILDAVAGLADSLFATIDVQQRLAAIHGIAMPQPTVATLLKRAVSKGQLKRDSGRYRKEKSTPLPGPSLLDAKSAIEDAQEGLADALMEHCARRHLSIPTREAALKLLLTFLEDQQVAILLGAAPSASSDESVTTKQRLVIAEFIQLIARADSPHRPVLKEMLEGLVLYHAAFLPDLQSATKHFGGLKVVFDSNLVRQALGYEGQAQRSLLRDTIDVLKASGAQCVVFDVTMIEIKRMLLLYEAKLATAEGRKTLRPVPMSREFLVRHYTPADVRELSALLEDDIHKAGFTLQSVPKHTREYTAGERALTQRLANPTTKDELEPRVVHDVDCVAAILSLRKNRRSNTIEDCAAVFAASSPMVIQTVRTWWSEDELETSLPPVVHIRALASLAWLKKPSLSAELKMHELVALCSAALRPSPETWRRFLRHLEDLRSSNRITSNEAAAVVVSALSEPLLREAELEADNPNDIDAHTLDDVVDKVKEGYAEEANAKVAQAEKAFAEEVERIQRTSDSSIGELKEDYERRLRDMADKAADADERSASLSLAVSENRRRRELLIDSQARSAAIRTILAVRAGIALLAVAIASAIAQAPFGPEWLRYGVGIGVVVAAGLELIGTMPHFQNWSSGATVRLTQYYRPRYEGRVV